VVGFVLGVNEVSRTSTSIINEAETCRAGFLVVGMTALAARRLFVLCTLVLGVDVGDVVLAVACDDAEWESRCCATRCCIQLVPDNYHGYTETVHWQSVTHSIPSASNVADR